MAIVNGIYKDKGRGIELKTSILDVRIKSFPYDTTTVSVDPTSAGLYADVGEWVLLNAAGNLVRPTLSTDSTALSAATKCSFAGHTNAAAGPPYMVYSDRGAMDVQAIGKIPVLMQGTKEGEIGLYAAASTQIVIGDDLCVMFVNGAHASFTTATGYTGVKGILVPSAFVISGSVASFGGATGAAAGGASLWVVGHLLKTTTAGSSTVYAELYSSPIRKTIVIG